MASRFTELCVDCSDPRRVAEFWRDVLVWELTADDDGDYYIESADKSAPQILFTKVPEGKTVKNRLHIDVSPRDRDQSEEVERIIALGATRIDIGQGDPSWVVLADPEGNEFCVLKTRRP
jgi:predicted enzyme related to lactoylglutathione lyase